jgi:hypothetical protein
MLGSIAPRGQFREYFGFIGLGVVESVQVIVDLPARQPAGLSVVAHPSEHRSEHARERSTGNGAGHLGVGKILEAFCEVAAKAKHGAVELGQCGGLDEKTRLANSVKVRKPLVTWK